MLTFSFFYAEEKNLFSWCVVQISILQNILDLLLQIFLANICHCCGFVLAEYLKYNNCKQTKKGSWDIEFCLMVRSAFINQFTDREKLILKCYRQEGKRQQRSETNWAVTGMYTTRIRHKSWAAAGSAWAKNWILLRVNLRTNNSKWSAHWTGLSTKYRQHLPVSTGYSIERKAFRCHLWF